jgi:hypothetical protein
MKFLALIALLCAPAFSQSHRREAVTKGYPPAFRGSIDVTVVHEEHAVLRVNAWSKWKMLNGSGAAIFRITATPFVDKEWIGARPTIAPKYMSDMRGCRFFLKITDKDSFPLGEVPLDMTDLVDSDGNKSSAEGVGQVKLSEDDYLEFAGGGSWTLGWSCPGQ